jgi:hypothetical protein
VNYLITTVRTVVRTSVITVLMMVSTLVNAHPGHGMAEGVSHQWWHISLTLVAVGAAYILLKKIRECIQNKDQKG